MPFSYPTARQLTAVDPVYVADLQAADPIFRHFPTRNSPSPELAWDQRDNYRGMQQFRGYGGEPKLVGRPGAKRYRAVPGVYGEFTRVNEEELTRRAAFGRDDIVIDIGDLVTESRDLLLYRQVTRVSWILWQLAVSGVYIVPDELGGIVDFGGYTVQTYVAPVAWDTFATADPLGDFRSVSTLGRGQSTSFNATAVGYLSQVTANWLVGNRNPDSLYGRRTANGSTVNGFGQANEILSVEGAPRLEVFEGGYYDDAGAWNLFVPDGYIVVFGTRDNGGRIGEFLYTPNRVNPGAASNPYVRTVERGMRDNEPPPPHLEVHRGMNGGAVIYYPGSILVMKVGPAA